MSSHQPSDEELAGWEESSQLLQFLQSQQGEGSLDSSDEFSVNVAAAQKKFGQYALPRPSAWVLKFVQCANEANCSELEFQFTEQRVEINFGEGELPEVLALEDHLRTLSPETAAEDHLIGGILALHSMDGQVFLEGDGRRWYPLSEEEPERLPEAQALRCVFIPPRLGFWDKLRARLGQTITALDELQQWCYASPTPLFIDGQELAGSVAEVPMLAGLLPGLEESVALNLGGSFSRDREDKKSVFCPWASSRPQQVGCAVRIDHRRKVKGENLCLDWLRSGVVVKREATKVEGVGSVLSRVLIPTDGLRFDLTGFNFEETALSRRRRIRGAYHLNQALLSLRGDLDRDSRWHRFLNKRHGDCSFATTNEERLLNQVNSQLLTVRSD